MSARMLYPTALRTRVAHGKSIHFTLVELLVVVSIIAVLAAILLPSLSLAREKARQAACISNERQIGIGFSLYTDDNADTYPYANPDRYGYYNNYSAAYIYNWRMALSPYLGKYKTTSLPKDAPAVLRCPSNPWGLFIGPNIQTWPPQNYAMGNAFPGTWHDSAGASYNPTVPGFESHYVKAITDSMIYDPQMLLLLGEVPNGDATSDPRFGRNFDGDNKVSYVPFRIREANYLAYWFDLTVAASTKSSGTHPQVMTPHNQSWNGLRTDGHVELDSRVKLSEYYYKATATRGNQFWFNTK